MLWAFIDESGQPSLKTSISGVGTHYVLCAVLVSDDVLEKARERADAIRRSYRQTGEIKSSAFGSRDPRRVKILRELTEIDFTYFLIVVDKRIIDGESGLQHKRSFIKYFRGILWVRLFRSHPEVAIRADKVGHSDFLDSFGRYVDSRKMRYLFDPHAPVEFVDSRDEVLVQVADLIAGTHRLAFENVLEEPIRSESLGLLAQRCTAIREWGRARSAQLEVEVESVASPLDDAIRRTSVRSAERFLHDHLDASDSAESLHLQKEVVSICLEHDAYGDTGRYLYADEIVRDLERAGLSTSKESLQRTIIPALRDSGVLIVSSEKGYKLPDCVSDVDRHVVRTENQIRPRLARLRELRAGLLVGTENAFDAVAEEHHAFLRTLLDVTEG